MRISPLSVTQEFVRFFKRSSAVDPFLNSATLPFCQRYLSCRQTGNFRFGVSFRRTAGLFLLYRTLLACGTGTFMESIRQNIFSYRTILSDFILRIFSVIYLFIRKRALWRDDRVLFSSDCRDCSRCRCLWHTILCGSSGSCFKYLVSLCDSQKKIFLVWRNFGDNVSHKKEYILFLPGFFIAGLFFGWK